MNLPEQYLFTQDHEWISKTTGEASVGLTSYALEQLGDVIYIDLPEVGQTFESGDTFGTIESTKTVSDLYLPCGGKIIAVNKDLIDQPEKVIEDPYENGWLIKVEVSQAKEELMDKTSYQSYLDGK